jgi:uncharacterized protein YkwD
LLVPETGAQRASRDPNRANNSSRGRRFRLALGAVLSASILVGIGAAPATAATIGQNSVGPSTGSTKVTTSSVSRPLYSYERYYLSLVNCTRTGGWVQPNGACAGYGSGQYSAYVAPLKLSAGISNRVSRPYSRFLAIHGVCSHYLDHDPGYRLRRGGYRSWKWGENIGCGNGFSSVKAAILWSHLRMQAEKSSNGGHWQNLKSTRFHYIGIGVSRSGARVRVVTDLYG